MFKLNHLEVVALKNIEGALITFLNVTRGIDNTVSFSDYKIEVTDDCKYTVEDIENMIYNFAGLM